MSTLLEEKLREAACTGDTEAILALLSQNVDVNAQNKINGWTALHWAAKRGHTDIVALLLNHGADKRVETVKGETPAAVCSNSASLLRLGDAGEDGIGDAPSPTNNDINTFVPNYIKNPPLIISNNNGHLTGGSSKLWGAAKHPDFPMMPTTTLPTTTAHQHHNDNDLVLCVRIAGGSDPDFIEVEIPRWKLTYSYLMQICCEELGVVESQVERIRKLPNIRLRKDCDVNRLQDGQGIEIVLKSPLNPDKVNNCYQSISTCKDQTILY